MICPHCQINIPDMLRFCTHCGSLVSFPMPRFTPWLRLFEQGCRAYRRGELADAVQFFAQCTQQHPSHHLSWYNLGTVHLVRSQPLLAIHCLRTAKQLDPYHEDTRINLAAALCRLKQHKAAVTELRSFYSLHPESNRAAKAAARLQQALNKLQRTN